MFFFFNDTATTEIYTLSLHDALPISSAAASSAPSSAPSSPPSSSPPPSSAPSSSDASSSSPRSEEHTSELQSRQYLVCRLLLEKKNTAIQQTTPIFTPVTPLSQIQLC